MLKEELEKLIDSKKFGKTIRFYGKDKLENVIKEIYYDGVRAGYDLAKFRLELHDGMPFGMADKYWSENMGNIRIVLDDYSVRFVPRIADNNTCNPRESYQ